MWSSCELKFQWIRNVLQRKAANLMSLRHWSHSQLPAVKTCLRRDNFSILCSMRMTEQRQTFETHIRTGSVDFVPEVAPKHLIRNFRRQETVKMSFSLCCCTLQLVLLKNCSFFIPLPRAIEGPVRQRAYKLVILETICKKICHSFHIDLLITLQCFQQSGRANALQLSWFKCNSYRWVQGFFLYF